MAFPVPEELSAQVAALPVRSFGSLSPRLALVATLTASLVPEGCDRLADVGADHGRLGRELLAHGVCRRVVSIDRSEAVVRALREAGPWPRGMEVRLADGLAVEVPGSVDCAVLAGFGGPALLSVVIAAVMAGHRIPRLVVQAQTEVALVGKELPALGYRSLGQVYVHERGRIYGAEGFERRSGDPPRPEVRPEPGQALLARAFELARERHHREGHHREDRSGVSESPPA